MAACQLEAMLVQQVGFAAEQVCLSGHQSVVVEHSQEATTLCSLVAAVVADILDWEASDSAYVEEDRLELTGVEEVGSTSLLAVVEDQDNDRHLVEDLGVVQEEDEEHSTCKQVESVEVLAAEEQPYGSVP